VKIEAGKYYRTRGGQKVGPMVITKERSSFNLSESNDKPGRWRSDGLDGFDSGTVNPGDLIAEWSEPMDLTAIPTPYGLMDAETQAALKEHGGPYQCFDDPEWADRDSINEGYGHWTWRVKPQPPKPREWWLTSQIAHPTEEKAQTFRANLQDDNPGMDFPQIVHVREVLE